MDSYLSALVAALAAAASDGGYFAGWTAEAVAHWTGVVLKVVLGLGAVIFVHELGHFLVAKACGVKCDKFYVGFDVPLGRFLNWLIGRPGELTFFGIPIPRTIGPRVKWGETEYGIGILPLGGYVKMLGQDDDPAHVAEQMQKSQVDASNANGVEVIGPNGEKYFVDRRSYVAKNVPQRMAIISAGVIMNVIFAFIFAVIAYGMGVPYMPSIVSETVPGSPAWKAGIEPGDQIVQIGDRKNPSFTQLRGGVTLGDLENGIHTVVRRADTGELETLLLKPEQGSGLATIGIMSPQTVTLLEGMPVAPGTPAEKATLIEPEQGEKAAASEAKNQRAETGLRGGDQIVRVEDAEIPDYRAWSRELVRHSNQPIHVTVRRPAKSRAANTNDTDAAANDKELTFAVSAQPMQGLGLVMRMGPIVAVQSDSPAEVAGLKPGDVIEAVDGAPFGSATEDGEVVDPATLPERLRQAALAEQSVTLTVSRQARDASDSADGPNASSDASTDHRESLTITVRPRVPVGFNSAVPPGAPLAADAIGIAYRIENRVAATVADSPAAKANIEPGDRITAAKFILRKGKNGQTPPPLKVMLVADGPGWLSRMLGRLFGEEPEPPANLPNWPFVHTQLQQMPTGTEIELTIESDSKTVSKKLAAAPVAGVFVAERGFHFEPVERIREADSLAEQIKFGWDETVESLTMVYRFLQKIGTQVPITALGGPVTIAKAAGYSASAGIPTFLVFLTMLSANLAVVNFLPIPLLDGGHMVFLAYEGARGRPANEKFVGAMHMVGFVFIVSLMLFVLGLDFGLIERNL